MKKMLKYLIFTEITRRKRNLKTKGIITNVRLGDVFENMDHQDSAAEREGKTKWKDEYYIFF